MHERRWDVIIVGTGAGGGTLLHALAPTGKKILVLERGDYVRREAANWSPRAVNVEGRYAKRGGLDEHGALHCLLLPDPADCCAMPWQYNSYDAESACDQSDEHDEKSAP